MEGLGIINYNSVTTSPAWINFFISTGDIQFYVILMMRLRLDSVVRPRVIELNSHCLHP